MGNNLTIKDTHAEITCKYKGNEYIVKISLEDVEDVQNLPKLSIMKVGDKMYVCFRQGDKKQLLHRHFLNAGKGDIVIMLDYNGLNVQRSNIVLTTPQTNASTKRIISPSGHRGVYRNRGKWVARLIYLGKTVYLGSYLTKAEAIRARRKAEEKYFNLLR